MKVKEDQISIINKGCKIEGQLYFNGHLIVEGIIQGTLNGESIFTEKDSHITATVHAKFLTVAGFFEGEIEADMLTLLKTANVEGHIRCHKLVVDEGGILNGSIKFISTENPIPNPT